MQVDVLAFGAHPDDIELTCGGTVVKLIRKGLKVGLIDVTAGERGSRGTPEERKREADSAASIMGASFRHCMDLPDGGIPLEDATVKMVVELIRTHRPDLLIAPHSEVAHPDHGIVNEVVFRASFYSGLAKWDAAGEAHHPRGVIYHMSRIPFNPSFVVDVSDTFDVRLEAIKAYESQLYREGFKPVGNLHKKWFLDSIIGRARHYGALIGAEFGEPFFVRGALSIDDPLAVFPAFD
jgi:bacillithiol biosynthesis deacetylase BshB1